MQPPRQPMQPGSSVSHDAPIRHQCPEQPQAPPPEPSGRRRPPPLSHQAAACLAFPVSTDPASRGLPAQLHHCPHCSSGSSSAAPVHQRTCSLLWLSSRVSSADAQRPRLSRLCSLLCATRSTRSPRRLFRPCVRPGHQAGTARRVQPATCFLFPEGMWLYGLMDPGKPQCTATQLV